MKSSEAPKSSDVPIQKQIAPKMQKSKDRISEKMADKGASSEKKQKSIDRKILRCQKTVRRAYSKTDSPQNAKI